jgi:hypothetical protein
MLLEEFGGHGHSTQFSVFRVLIGFFGAAVVGSIAIGIVFLAIVGCQIKTFHAAF